MRAGVLVRVCQLALGCFCERAVRADARLCACATVRVERKRRLREVIKGGLEKERKEGLQGTRERESKLVRKGGTRADAGRVRRDLKRHERRATEHERERERTTEGEGGRGREGDVGGVLSGAMNDPSFLPRDGEPGRRTPLSLSRM